MPPTLAAAFFFFSLRRACRRLRFTPRAADASYTYRELTSTQYLRDTPLYHAAATLLYATMMLFAADAMFASALRYVADARRRFFAAATRC